MASEFAPPPPKVRVTKAQLRKQQENYRKAAAMAEDHSEKEAHEKKQEISHIEEKFNDVF